MRRYRPAVLSKVRAVTFGVFLCLGLAALGVADRVAGNFDPSPMPTPTRRPTRTPSPPKYSKFPHDVKAHRVSCGECHKFPSDNWQKVRAEKDGFPDITEYPKHESCLNCHKQQFFNGARPTICSICHTNPSPRNSERHAFPNPRERFDTTAKGRTAISDFAITFPHDKHIEIVASTDRLGRFENAAWSRSANRRNEASCSVCHQTYKPQDKSDDEFVTARPAAVGEGFWLKKGTFKTAPIGHATCFTCHSADSGMSPAPTDCATCHALKAPEAPSDFDSKLAATMGINDKIMRDSWRRRDSSATFRHEWFSHSELSCATCHNVAAMNTADPKTTRVTISSCAVCHVTATTDEGGALNFEIDARKADSKFQCAKCHVAFGKSPIPDSHIKAVAAAK